MKFAISALLYLIIGVRFDIFVTDVTEDDEESKDVSVLEHEFLVITWPVWIIYGVAAGIKDAIDERRSDR